MNDKIVKSELEIRFEDNRDRNYFLDKLLNQSELLELIKILQEERDAWKANALAWEKEYKSYSKY